MTQSKEGNPCCNQRGTLIITIEPCNRGRDEVTDNENKQIVNVLPDEYDIPGLSPKTPKTMEIEIKIKGKDQQLFSDEQLRIKRESPPFKNKYEKGVPMITKTQHKSEEIFSEHELISLDLEPDEKFAKLQTHIVQKRKYSSESSKSSESISIEKQICPKTCPGKLICAAKKHFMGDKCKLHDPTDIGKQILEMHKSGKIRKISANIDKNIYPDFLICSVSEIQKKMQEKANDKQKKENATSDSGNSIQNDSSEYEISESSRKSDTSSKSQKEKPVVKPEKPVEKKKVQKLMKPRTGSGCFC